MSNLSRSIADALEEHLDGLRWAKAQEEISKLETELDATFQDSPEKEKNMELQQDSREYKEFLRMIECLAKADDWAHYKHYRRFYKDNEDRQEMLLLAVFHEKIKYKFRKEHWSAYGDMDNIDDRKNIIEHCLNGGLTGISKERKEAFESSFYEPRPSPLLLKAESFLTWLNEEYPYEGKEQQNEEPKENQFYMSDELQLAIACSRELYPITPPKASTPGEKKTNERAENKRLREWLQRNGVEGRRKPDRIRIMVNPYTD